MVVERSIAGLVSFNVLRPKFFLKLAPSEVIVNKHFIVIIIVIIIIIIFMLYIYWLSRLL